MVERVIEAKMLSWDYCRVKSCIILPTFLSPTDMDEKCSTAVRTRLSGKKIYRRCMRCVKMGLRKCFGMSKTRVDLGMFEGICMLCDGLDVI